MLAVNPGSRSRSSNASGSRSAKPHLCSKTLALHSQLDRVDVGVVLDQIEIEKDLLGLRDTRSGEAGRRNLNDAQLAVERTEAEGISALASQLPERDEKVAINSPPSAEPFVPIPKGHRVPAAP